MGSHSQYQSQTSSSPSNYSDSETATNMTRGTTDSNKPNKRKGTRSVSTLTPSQLARKRANDREAQRAIRARTKEHIESLERQVEELRSQQGHDRFVQDLLRRNKSLEDELRRLRESLGLPANGGSAGSIYTSSSSGYSGASLRTPPFCPAMPEYQVVQDGHGQYNHMPESGENWPQTSMPGSVSTVSSPSSRNEEYGTNNYLSNGMQSGVLERVSSMTPGVNSAMSSPGMGIKGGFEDIKSEYGMPPVSVVPLTSTFHAQQPWNVYPMYYPGSPATL